MMGTALRIGGGIAALVVSVWWAAAQPYPPAPVPNMPPPGYSMPPGAQGYPPGVQPYPQPPGMSPYPGAPVRGGEQGQACIRLEAQLAALDRGSVDPTKAEQISRYEAAANKQQFELDRVVAESRRIGCQGGGFFSLFIGQPPQCEQLTGRIQQMRVNLDRILGDLERLRGNTADREGQRRSLLLALGQNDCGPQYRAAVQNQSRGLFGSLFGPGSIVAPELPQSSTYRTLCVRTCDGYYFPVSYSTVPGRFADDERVCQRMCPASEVTLFAHRNPGEDVAQAVSINGMSYSDLPNAFRYRREINQACSCRRQGESWASTLRNVEDTTLERGDIVVTEERAKQLSQPQAPRGRQPAPAGAPAAKPQGAGQPAAPAPAVKSGDATSEKRSVRTVVPPFLPAR
jgi:hypothetical protein